MFTQKIFSEVQMSQRLSKSFMENASALIYHIRQSDTGDVLKKTSDYLSKKSLKKKVDSESSKQRRIMRTLEKLLSDGYVKIAPVEEKILQNKRLSKAIKECALPNVDQRFIDYVRDEKHITIFPFVSIESLFDCLRSHVCDEIHRIVKDTSGDESILIYYGSTLAQFADSIQFPEQTTKQAVSITKNRHTFSIFVPTIGNMFLPNISPEMFSTLEQKSSNKIVSILSSRLYGDNYYNLCLVSQPAFLCLPTDTEDPRKIKEAWQKGLQKSTVSAEYYISKSKSFIFSLGPTTQLKPNQFGAFQKIYELLDSQDDSKIADYWKKEVQAELLGRVYGSQGLSIGKEDPEMNEYYSNPRSIEERFQNFNYVNLGISTRQLQEISSYYYQQSLVTSSQPLPMGACAVIGGDLPSQSKAKSGALFIHKSKYGSAPVFNKLYCLDAILNLVMEEVLKMEGENDRFDNYCKAKER